MKQDRTTEQSEKLRQMLREAALRRPFTQAEKDLQAKLDAELRKSKPGSYPDCAAGGAG